MNPAIKLVLAGVGFYIGGIVVFWAIHSKDALDFRFWLGFIISGFASLGPYLIGLAQKPPQWWGRQNSDGGN